MAPSGPAVKRWSTSGLEPALKVGHWERAVRAAHLGVACTPYGKEFDGELACMQHGDIRISSAVTSPHRLSPVDRKNAFFLMLDAQHGWSVREDGHFQAVRPHDIAVVDGSRQVNLDFPSGGHATSVELPQAWMQRWLQQVSSPHPRVISSASGWGRVLSAQLAGFGRDVQLAADVGPVFLPEMVGELLAAALEPGPAGMPPPGLAARARRHMLGRLHDASLTPNEVAAALGVSTRTLNRAFAAAGNTVTASLRGLRLAAAARMLRAPRMQQLSVEDISRRCGFASPSHFAREFKRQWGVAPARWRAEQVAQTRLGLQLARAAELDERIAAARERIEAQEQRVAEQQGSDFLGRQGLVLLAEMRRHLHELEVARDLAARLAGEAAEKGGSDTGLPR